MAGLIGSLIGKKLAREADAFWDEVRAAVKAEMGSRGPLAVHALHQALPAGLKRRGEQVGLPLTPAWLRYHLLRRAQAGDGVAEVDGRFAMAAARPPAPPPATEPAAPPPAPVDPVPPMLSGGRFWKLFVAEVHDLLLEAGPLSVDDILAKLPPDWVEATRRYGKAGDRKTSSPASSGKS